MSGRNGNRNYPKFRNGIVCVAILLAGLVFARPATSQGNPAVFNNAPTIALPSVCSTESSNFFYALGNVTNHANGTLDLAMICGQNIVTVPGNGDGTFATASSQTTPITSPSFLGPIVQISLADIDGDGKLDLVTTDELCNVDVFLGTGLGTFSGASQRTMTPVYCGTAPEPFLIADFNGDGKPDIALENLYGGTPSVTVFLNTSVKGSVSFTANSAISVGSSSQQFTAMTAGNFTGHTAPAVPDLAVTVGTFVSGTGFTDQVFVLKNSGNGTSFTAQVSVTLPVTKTTGTIAALAAANLSSDGFADVAAVDSSDGVIYVLNGHGTGNLTSCSPSGSTTTIAPCQSSNGQTITGLPLLLARHLLSGNFNGPSGPPGLLFTSANDCISVLLGAAGGGLQTTPITYVVGASTTGVVMADVNNDGFQDAIASANKGLSVFLNNTGGTLEGTEAFLTGTAPGEISLLNNFFGNGEQDVAVVPLTGLTPATVTVLGAPASGPSGTLPQVFGPEPISVTSTAIVTALTSGCILVSPSPCASPFVAAATFDSGGAAPGSSSGTSAAVIIYLSTSGLTKPTSIFSLPGGPQATAMVAGDFNGDGKTDLAFAFGSTNQIEVFTGNGDGTFSTTPLTFSLGAGASPVALAVADFNGDGKADIAVLNQGTNSVGILLNNTSSGVGAAISFAAMVAYPSGLTSPTGFTVGDFNGDHKPDIAVATASSPTAIAVLLNQGGGVFPTSAPTSIPLSFLGGAIATGDFNGDGVLDLAVTLCCSADNVEILNGKGDGTFATTPPTLTFWSVGANPAAMVVADFNGDNKLDIAVADGDPEGQTVALLLNGTAAADAPPPGSTPPFAQYSTIGPINFGEVVVNTTGTQTLTLTNTGTGSGSSFAVNGITLSGSDATNFSIASVVCNGSTVTPNPSGPPYSPMSVNLAPGGTCTMNLQFEPNLVQNGYAELLTIATTTTNSNASAGPGGTGQSLLLVGDGIAAGPIAIFSAGSVGLGSAPVGSASPAEQLTLQNEGTQVMTVSSITFGNPSIGPKTQFYISSARCGASAVPPSPFYPISVTAGDICTFTLDFTPQQAGNVTSQIIFTETATSSNICTPGSLATCTTGTNGTLTEMIPLSGTGTVTPVGTTTTITSTTTSFDGFALATNTALVNTTPVTVNFTVSPASGSTTPTGTVVVTDGFNDTCPAATLSAGKGSCVLTVSQLGTGSTPLTAKYTPDATATSSGLTSSSSSPVTEFVLEISTCGPNNLMVNAPAGQTTTITFNVCLAGNVSSAPHVATSNCSATGCTVTTATITAVSGQPGVYLVTIVITTTGSVPPRGREPWGKPLPLTLFVFGMLLVMLMALQLARQKRPRPRLLYAAGFLIAVLLSGISGCSNALPATPPGTYTINVTVTAGAFTLTVPLSLTVTQ